MAIASGVSLFEPHDARERERYLHGLNQLVQSGLMESRGGGVFSVAYQGYLIADEIMTSGPAALLE